ncbi:MAG: bifunctional acetaldehyde-CoA/alcohol dehydrogenase [Bacillota bacterium]
MSKQTKAEDTEAKVIELVDNGIKAADSLNQMNQQEIDQIVAAMAKAGVDNHIKLAKLAVEETGMGLYEDKITKNLFATETIYHDIKDKQTRGVINNDQAQGIVEIAEPVGLIAALIPATNPTSTILFKSLIALKAGNPVIFSFHPAAFECSKKTAQVMHQAAVEAGAPEGTIQWIEPCSKKTTAKLMEHSDLSLILATGGSSMVKAAYSSGTPAIGVGPGNVPAYIEESANLKQAVYDVVASKTFDNGTICASEQTLIVDQAIIKQVKRLLRHYHAYILDEGEIKQVEEVAINSETKTMNSQVVGQSAVQIAQMAGIEVPEETTLLVAPLAGIGTDYPLSREKLSPILGLIEVEDYNAGIERIIDVIRFDGMGHTAVLHSHNKEVINRFKNQIKAGRLLLNTPATFGAVGGIYNNLTPSLTLGCGTFGGNSTTANVSVEQLYNIKRSPQRKIEREWIKLPQEIYFNPGSLAQLGSLTGEKALIVTDQVMQELGYVKQATDYLEQAGIDYQVFAEVEEDPAVETVTTGTELAVEYGADIIIALGGGSPLDAAKGIWLFYEAPETDFTDLKLRFLDIKKRVYDFPRLGQRSKFVAIPTTSGSGSEITSFAVITDKKEGVKYPLVSYQLTPDVAIIDANLARTLPPKTTAYTGLDVLTHAVEAYVSVMSSDYTDPLALQAIDLVFEYLPRAYNNGAKDRQAREKMHHAACIAGIAFSNAFLGINHSLAHILGSKFNLPHGLANAILLPQVINYNAAVPTNFAHYPNYRYHTAAKQYQEILKHLGISANTTDEAVTTLIDKIKELITELDVPLSLAQVGIERSEFESQLEEMATIAYSDQSTTANPRKPLIRELEEIYRQAYQIE